MVGTDTVRLTPLYGWRCPACGRFNIETVCPVDENLAPPEVVRQLRRRWRVPDNEPIPSDKLFTWPRDVTCVTDGCGLEFNSEVGELSILDRPGDS